MASHHLSDHHPSDSRRPAGRSAAAAALVSMALLAAPLLAATPAAPASAPAASAVPDDALQALSYRLVGPFRGGRSTAVSGVPGVPGTFYMGTTGGGVWKTTDYGETWRNVSDMAQPDPEAVLPRPMGLAAGGAREGVEVDDSGTPPARKVRRDGDPFGVASVGAVAVAPSDPNVVWVGTGSACIRGNVSAGDGVYRSTDGGRTWHHVGLEEAGQIGRIRVHPTDPDTAWVAALGHAFGANRERGVFRTRDGGASWENVLWVSDEAGAVDLALDATNPRVLYAATWQAVRKPWTMISGGPGSGLFRSTDGGDTWVELTEGLPEGIKGRIGVTVSPARPNRVWALVEHAEKAGLYRSDDGGDSFRRVSDDANLTQRPWYYTHVYADPQDADTVYVLNVQMWRSTDGGRSFTPLRTPHGDNHDLWIDPADPRVMIEANDGGSNVTTDGGRSWSTQANQPTAEMYRVTVDEQHPYWLYGGQQDNSAVAIPSRSRASGIARQDWYAPGGCESAWVAVDPRDPDVTWAGCYGGSVERHDHATGHTQEVTPWPQLGVGRAAKDLRFRFQWNTPIHLSIHDPQVLYVASNHLHRSRDGGQTWELASPDLTRDDPAKQTSAGGPITQDNTGVEVYDTIFAFAESRQRPGVLWVGSDDGLVHVSEDDGATWRDVTPAGMPEWGTVNAIETSPHADGRVFLAVHRYRLDDFRPYVFRSDDLGATWKPLADGGNGLPADQPVRVVREDPARRGLLYAGTEVGVFVSFDDGATWRPLQLDLPVTPVTDLRVQRGDLVVATQGRSYWILDDLTPLHHLGGDEPSGTDAAAVLYPPRDAVLYPGGRGGGDSEGANPPRGATIYYRLADDLSADGAREVKIEILDAAGEVLRSMSSQEEEETAPNPFLAYFPEFARPHKLEAGKGLQRWVWDFALPDAHLVDDALLWGSAGGPEVPPGDYRVRLTLAAAEEGVEATVLEQPLTVVQDPLLDVPVEAVRERFALARQIHAAVSRLHHGLDDLRSVRTQVAALAERLGDDAPQVQEAAKAAREALDGVEARITQAKARAVQDVLNLEPQLDNQLLMLYAVVESADGRPTAAAYERWDELSAEVDAVLADLAAAMDGPVAAFNDAVAATDAATVGVAGGDWRPAMESP
jgi:photosystem II stability/assembly factor-like uncharacterized protein